METQLNWNDLNKAFRDYYLGTISKKEYTLVYDSCVTRFQSGELPPMESCVSN